MVLIFLTNKISFPPVESFTDLGITDDQNHKKNMVVSLILKVEHIHKNMFLFRLV